MKVIELFGEIGQWFADGWDLQRLRSELKDAGGRVVIDLKSDGGDLMEALAIRDELIATPARVDVNIVGATASAATIISTGADYIRMRAGSRYLIHNTAIEYFGRLTAADAEAVAEQLESFDNQAALLYVKRTGRPIEEIKELMKQNKWLTAEEAKEWGFIDEIINPIILNKMDEKEKLIEELKLKNAELEAQIAELEEKLKKYEEADLEKQLESAGVTDEEGKKTLKALAKIDAGGFKKILSLLAAKPSASTSISGVVANVVRPKLATKADAWEAYKKGEITAMQYEEIANKLKN